MGAMRSRAVRVTAVVLSVVMAMLLLPCFPVTILAQEDGTALEAQAGDIASGEGWRLTSDGQLVITGVVPGWTSLDAVPWAPYRGQIRSAVASEGASASTCQYMFCGCSSLRSVDLSLLDVSRVTDMSYMFYDCSSLVSLDLSSWDTSSAKDMSSMFSYCQALTSLDFSGWETSSVTSMSWMFSRCQALTSLDLSGFDTSSVLYMNSMFDCCFNLAKLDLSCLDTSSVTSMYRLFFGCKDLASLDLTGIDTSSVVTMGCMFYGCSSLTSIDLSNLDTSSVGSMESMFYECSSLASLDLSNFDTSSVTDMRYMFCNCARLKTITVSDLWSNEWAAGDCMSMFLGCTSLVGGRGTAYSPDHVDGEYARVDAEGVPGYLTLDSSPTIPPPITEPGSIMYGTPVDGTPTLSFSCQFGGKSTLDTAWRDSWFGGGFDGYRYDHDVARACSVLAVASYKKDCIEEDLERLGFFEFDSYFPDQEGGYKSDWDECGYAFGIKTFTDPGTGKQVPLIAVVVRGSIGNGEWLGNFNVANSSPSSPPATHEGFGRCRNRILGDLDKWVGDLNLVGLDLENARVLVTGHSRGAAVAGLIASSLDDGYKLAGHKISPSNVCAYTFASPTTSKWGQNKSQYYNTFNIVNPEDLIPKLPLGTWGYQRLGTTLVLPSKTNTGHSRYASLRWEMNSFFRDIAKGNSYQPYLFGSATAQLAAMELGAGVPSVGELYFKGVKWLFGHLSVTVFSCHDLFEAMVRGFIMGGNKALASAALVDLAARMPRATPLLVATFAADSVPSLMFEGIGWSKDHVVYGHTGEIYISWMMALDGLGDFAGTHTGLMIACPVDVRVYAPDGELVAEIVDNEVNEGLLEDGLAAWVDGDAKHVELPDEEAYRVELTPTGDGEMDVALTHRDANDGVIEQLGYDGLALEEGEGYELTTSGEASEETAIADTTELVGPGSEPVEPDYTVSGDGLGSIALTVTAEGAGDVVCPASATRGDYVTARAIAGEGGSFEGWYEGGELISGDAEYQFCARTDRSLVARFSTGLSGATVTGVADQVYTGRAVEPRPVVRLGGRTLRHGTDYEVSYENNVGVGTATVRVTGIGDYAGTREATFRIAGSSAGWRRLSGEGRYDTMASIVGEGFDSSEWAVVAFGRNFPDALAAAPLAGYRDCPVILTEGGSLSAQARSELGRLGVRHAYVMGGTGVVSGRVEEELTAMGIEVVRVAGGDRQQTSARALRELAPTEPATVVVATGTNYADTLSIGPWCYREAAPILLTGWDGRLTEEQVAAVRACPSVTGVVIVGGTGAVSADVEGQLAGYSVERLAGPDRYATSALVAKWEMERGMGVSHAAVATGANFPDALAGAALCGRNGSVLLLSLDAGHGKVALRDVLEPHAAEVYQGYVLGGEGAVPEGTLDYLKGITK